MLCPSGLRGIPWVQVVACNLDRGHGVLGPYGCALC